MEICVFLFILIPVCFLILTIPYIGGKTLTGRAVVVSKRAEAGHMGSRYSSCWLYIITFRLSDGEELELYTFENIYNTLTEGMTGILTWHNENLSNFEPDKEDF